MGCLKGQDGSSNSGNTGDENLHPDVPDRVEHEWATYQLNESGTGYVLTSWKYYEGEEVRIPSEFNGLPVVAINTIDTAVFEESTIARIYIPSTVTYITSDAFTNLIGSIELVFESAEGWYCASDVAVESGDDLFANLEGTAVEGGIAVSIGDFVSAGKTSFHWKKRA